MARTDAWRIAFWGDLMKYQLVIQFAASSVEDFDAMVELEDEIENILGSDHVLDGHDIGSGEMNIFIHTNDPSQALSLIKTTERLNNFENFVAAFREFKNETYEVLWPKNYEREFCIV